MGGAGEMYEAFELILTVAFVVIAGISIVNGG